MDKVAKLAGFFAAGLLSYSTVALADSQNTVTVDAFDAIELEGLAILRVQVGGEQSIIVSARRESYLDNIHFEVDDGVLHIDMEGTFLRNPDFQVKIVVPSLSSLDIAGLIDATVENINTEEFTLNMEGIGDILLSGQCDTLNAELEGASDLEARNLTCQNVYMDLEGASDVTVYASEIIEAETSGTGDIVVYGGPQVVRPTVSGMGSFRVIEDSN